MERWQDLSCKNVVDNPYMLIREHRMVKPGGKTIEFLMWHQGEGTVIVPVTTDKKFILIKSYKPAIDDFIIEFPGGGID